MPKMRPRAIALAWLRRELSGALTECVVSSHTIGALNHPHLGDIDVADLLCDRRSDLDFVGGEAFAIEAQKLCDLLLRSLPKDAAK